MDQYNKTILPSESSKFITGEFYYRADDDRVRKCCPFEYNDSYFDHPTDRANFDLIRFSLKLAMSASRREDILDFYDKIGFSYTSDTNYEEEGLNILAGAKVIDSVYYPAQTVDGIPYINSIAYAIGYKKLKDKTIVLVTIRGGDYGIEWGGNFNIGTEIDHIGFKIASDQVLEGIKNCISKIQGPVRLHLTGYSRAAAVSNLTAARIDKGEIEKLSKDNTSCYTYEAPRNTRNEEAFNEKFSNIFNVVNPSDVIPKVAFSAWGYRRYGKELNLPAYQTDRFFPKKFIKMEHLMKERLKTVYDLSVDDVNIVDKFVDDIAYIMKDPENYVKEYQTILEKIFMGFETGKPLLDKSEREKFDRFVEILNLVDPINLKRMHPLLKMDTERLTFSFSSPLLSNHKMGTELSWIESFNSLDDFGPGDHLLAYVSEPKFIKISSMDEDLLLFEDKISRDLPNELWNGKNINGETVIILDQDRDYDLTLKLDNKKNSQFSIYHYDQRAGIRTSGMIYEEKRLDETELIEGSISRELIRSKFYLNKASLDPSKFYKNDLPKITVRVKCHGPGEAIGGGYFYPGMVCRLEARSFSDHFIGWFEEDNCLSTEKTFIFKPEKDTFIIARFD